MYSAQTGRSPDWRLGYCYLERPLQRCNRRRVKLSAYLARLGYGTRRDVERLCAEGRVTHRAGRRLATADQAAHADILVDGEPLDVPPGTVIMLHKPVGFVCSISDMSRRRALASSKFPLPTFS